MESGVNGTMEADLGINPLLEILSNDVMTSLFQTEAYRLSPPDPTASGATTLLEQLHREFTPALATYARENSVPITPAIVSGNRGMRDRSPMYRGMREVAARFYNPVLIADLSDPKAPRHDVAHVEFYALTQSHLRQAEGHNNARLSEVVQKAAKIGLEQEDIYRDFLTIVWRRMLRGNNPLSHPYKLQGYLRAQARGYLSNWIRDHKDENDHTLTSKVSSEVLDLLIEHEASNVLIPYKWYDTSAVAIANVTREEDIQWVLDAYLPESRQNRLGFLIYLHQRYGMPNLAFLGIPEGGPLQEITAVLQRWRNDPNALADFLLDPDRGLGLRPALVRAIVNVTAEGFAKAPDPITTTFVKNLYARYIVLLEPRLAALQDRLMNMKDDPETNPDEATEAEHA